MNKEEILKHLIFEAIGEASMCWFETPKGVFDTGKAEVVGNKLIEEIKNLYNN